MARKPTGKSYVYRYIDNETGVIKYVGIVHSGTLSQRITAHRSSDSWKFDACWRIEYFECENRSEAEAFESHLISLYGTDKYYNKSKKSWGVNHFLPDVESWWKVAEIPLFADTKSLRLGKLIKDLIKSKRFDEARIVLDCIEFQEVEYGKNGQTEGSN